jgi:glutamine synthetase
MNKKTDLTGISWVQLSVVDVFGANHSMQVPAARFAAAVLRGEPFDGSALEGRARLIETDMRLRPDPDTLIRTEAGLARAVCTVLTKDGAPWPGDPRTALARVIEQVGQLGRDYTAAAELEFYLLDEDGMPVDGGGYFEDTGGPGMGVVRAAADRLAAWDIPVDSVHHEAGPGQYEIDISPLPAMGLADALVLAKQALRSAAAAAGLRASFMPAPFDGEAGSGMHLHQRSGSRLIDETGGLRDEGRAFLAGQLVHARGLSALAAPTVNSYKRLLAGPEAPSAAVWAHANRGALVRLSPIVAGGSSLEFRGADPSANPYLLLAGLLITGWWGMQTGAELPPAFEEEIGGFDPAGLDSARFDLLPRDLDEAIGALLADDVLVDAFEAQLLSRFTDGRRAEAEAYRTQVTPWEIERYLDEA